MALKETSTLLTIANPSHDLLPQQGSVTVSSGEKNAEILSYTSKYVNVALIVAGIAAIIILSLGGASQFGVIGSVGSIVSMSLGSALLLTSLIILVITNFRKSNSKSIDRTNASAISQTTQEIEPESFTHFYHQWNEEQKLMNISSKLKREKYSSEWFKNELLQFASQYFKGNLVVENLSDTLDSSYALGFKKKVSNAKQQIISFFIQFDNMLSQKVITLKANKNPTLKTVKENLHFIFNVGQCTFCMTTEETAQQEMAKILKIVLPQDNSKYEDFSDFGRSHKKVAESLRNDNLHYIDGNKRYLVYNIDKMNDQDLQTIITALSEAK